MPKHIVVLSSSNADIADAATFWHGDDDVFIEQIEKDTGKRHLLLFGREAVPDLIKSLKKFLGEVPMHHDSDCATHNEPAYPNGPCDCSVSQ